MEFLIGMLKDHWAGKRLAQDLYNGLKALEQVQKHLFPSDTADKEIAFVSHGTCDPLWFQKECNRVGLPVPDKWKFVSSIEFACKLLGSGSSVSLESLSKRYNIHR